MVQSQDVIEISSQEQLSKDGKENEMENKGYQYEVSNYLPFQRRVIEELIEDDGLTILAQGLERQGLEIKKQNNFTWTEKFIQHSFISETIFKIGYYIYRDQFGALVNQTAAQFLTNKLSRHQQEYKPTILGESQFYWDLMRAKGMLFEGNYGEVGNMFNYLKQLLPKYMQMKVVDFLSERLHPEKVRGIILMNSHRVTETSGEGFAIRLYRQKNHTGFCRAISDDSVVFKAGFNKIEKAMKALGVMKLNLWPRFHTQVNEDLDKMPCKVIDVWTDLTDEMRAIQHSIWVIMDSLLKDLAKTNKLDNTELTVDYVQQKDFSRIVRKQLDPIWHTVGRKTVQIVQDLQVLEELSKYLLSLDPVTFLRQLQQYRQASDIRSVWVFHPATSTLFTIAKNRVYKIVSQEEKEKLQKQQIKNQNKKTRNKRIKMKPQPQHVQLDSSVMDNMQGGPQQQQLSIQLEIPPKWIELQAILKEIYEEKQKIQQALAKVQNIQKATEKDIQKVIKEMDLELESFELEKAQNCVKAPVFVVAQNLYTSQQLHIACRNNGAQQLLQNLFEEYLLEKMDRSSANQKNRKPAGKRYSNERNQLNHLAIPGEQDVLNEAAQKLQQQLENVINSKDVQQQQFKNKKQKRQYEQDQMNKLKFQSVKQGNHQKNFEEVIQNGQAINNQNEMTSKDKYQEGNAEKGHTQKQNKNLQKLQEEQEQSKVTNQLSTLERNHSAELAPSKGYIVGSGENYLDDVVFISLDHNLEYLIWDLNPAYVILYDIQLGFVRQLELYKAQRWHHLMAMYWMTYENSIEHQRYLISVNREKQAMLDLINMKGHLALPQDHLKKQDLQVNEVYNQAPQTVQLSNPVSRMAGGQLHKNRIQPTKVVVDMREFVSPLPGVLYQKGLNICPVTLEVGDYILSPEICVERKALPDLVQSFTHGRLVQQVEQMSRHYQIPVLLIEFEQEKAFALQPLANFPQDIDQRSLQSKLTLLTLHFPRLRIIWSRSLHATADIFTQLKNKQSEPDPEFASKVGIQEELQEEFQGTDNIINPQAVDVLRKLPGVTEANYRFIVKKCRCLADLANMRYGELYQMMGSQKGARALKEFLDTQVPTMFMQ